VTAAPITLAITGSKKDITRSSINLLYQEDQ